MFTYILSCCISFFLCCSHPPRRSATSVSGTAFSSSHKHELSREKGTEARGFGATQRQHPTPCPPFPNQFLNTGFSFPVSLTYLRDVKEMTVARSFQRVRPFSGVHDQAFFWGASFMDTVSRSADAPRGEFGREGVPTCTVRWVVA